MEPLATDCDVPEFELNARRENRIAPIVISQRAATDVKMKKVILKTKSWPPEMEMEPCTFATPI